MYFLKKLTKPKHFSMLQIVFWQRDQMKEYGMWQVLVWLMNYLMMFRFVKRKIIIPTAEQNVWNTTKCWQPKYFHYLHCYHLVFLSRKRSLYKSMPYTSSWESTANHYCTQQAQWIVVCAVKARLVWKKCFFIRLFLPPFPLKKNLCFFSRCRKDHLNALQLTGMST